MKTLLSLIKLHNLNSQYPLQSYCDYSEQITDNDVFTNKPFGDEARENSTRGFPRS